MKLGINRTVSQNGSFDYHVSANKLPSNANLATFKVCTFLVKSETDKTNDAM